MPVAALIAVVIMLGRALGRRTERWTGRHTALRTLACATDVGVCLTAYALLTGRSPVEAALSGHDALAGLAAHLHDRPVAALVALVVCEGLAWGVALGSLRGGPVFPAMLPGAAIASACSGLPASAPPRPSPSARHARLGPPRRGDRHSGGPRCTAAPYRSSVTGTVPRWLPRGCFTCR
ncbi:hypothetical protein AB0K93_29550 [Streptomyces sp. NPDC052676]|uniref:hypothetical protein n=1 Tax=Streptomyces sp. NPDC052676 TaxID=3154953 RepID=UPI00341DBAA1